MGIYPMAISQSEHDKFPWGRIRIIIIWELIRTGFLVIWLVNTQVAYGKGPDTKLDKIL